MSEHCFGICLGDQPPITTRQSSEFAWLHVERVLNTPRNKLKQLGYELVWLRIDRLPIPDSMERVSR